MSLKSVYERFLASPNPICMSENASLHYIPTLRTFTQPGAIIRHLESQAKNEVRKKAEKIIATVEGQSSLSLDVETNLEFISGGGAYLPGLEEFVANQTAILPSIHIINFDDENKIQRIRIYWDQASLLKQVDVIGSRGKNWPVTDGKAQARLIASALSGTKIDAPVPREREMNNGVATSHSIPPGKKRIEDPHASLSLFVEQSNEEDHKRHQPAIIAPRVSAKPPDHNYSELFAAGNEENAALADSSLTSGKAHAQPVASKGAGGSSYQPSRIFDEGTPDDLPARYKSNPDKYNHFDLGDAVENDHFQHSKQVKANNSSIRAKTSGHLSQWDFEDFRTPEKIQPRVREQDIRHFGWGDDEVERHESPVKQSRLVQSRRDVEAHFNFNDDGPPETAHHRPTGRPKGSSHNTGLGLYENNLFDDGINDMKYGKDKGPLSAGTTNLGRSKDLDHHWAVSDPSSAPGEGISNENRPFPGDRTAVRSKPLRKGMEPHWMLGEFGDN